MTSSRVLNNSSLKRNPLEPTGKSYRTYQGSPHPFGSTVESDGVNFSLYSSSATNVRLLIFNKPDDLDPVIEISLDSIENKSFNVWHIFVEGVKPGMGYAYRVDGPHEPWNGHRFDLEKVLVDPYSKGNCFKLWDRGSACVPGDNLHKSLRSVVIDVNTYDWEDDQPLKRPMAETIVYEMHVGGFTKSPTSGVNHPGTYLGLIEKIPYLKSLGITAVELLPVFSFDHTDIFKEFEGRELKNYWGYSTMGYFAPHQDYCINDDITKHLNEFRDMVKALHKAGIEVILDVVYNHTDEGNHQGPMFSFKGIDNSSYYYLTGSDGNKDFYYDYTGCGNTFNCNHPVGEKLIIDSLRFWVKEMHVDGFRFDEGSVLSRGEDGVPLEHPPVVWSIELDDLLGQAKVIAEAWDAAGLYQIGTFPGARWAEWNGKYRDCIRGFVKGDPGLLGELAGRLTGSADLYQYRHHEPTNSVNFVCAHDGFTLYDLTAYNEKHNWANGEGSNDGIDDNVSWNCGVEGETTDSWINDLRQRQVKNFAVTHMLSMGVPMIVAGDEFMRSQGGNNNTYCHDNEINWFDWNKIGAKDSQDMIRFWSLLIQKRKKYIDHFKGKYFSGESNKYGLSDISWHGTKLYSPGWDDSQARCLAMTLGDTAQDSNQDLNIHVMFNMYWEALDFEIPKVNGLRWYRAIDTSLPSPNDISLVEDQVPIDESTYTLTARSVVVLASRATS
ncbi:glycogen debranching protein GlgX [Synechococcus sp. AH-601-O20]|nr:glycogen debranching protein GlgX [Synechococcus sp. AH-601-O20]